MRSDSCPVANIIYLRTELQGPYHLHSAESRENPKALTFRVPKDLLSGKTLPYLITRHEGMYDLLRLNHVRRILCYAKVNDVIDLCVIIPTGARQILLCLLPRNTSTASYLLLLGFTLSRLNAVFPHGQRTIHTVQFEV